MLEVYYGTMLCSREIVIKKMNDENETLNKCKILVQKFEVFAFNYIQIS
jgi:hypothetical protein